MFVRFCGLFLAPLFFMKNTMKKIAMLGKVTNLKTRIKDYHLVAKTFEEFVLRQERFIERVSWRTQLPPKLIKTLIRESTTIMTFAVLLGFDLRQFKGAAIGAAVGFVVLLGNAAFRIMFIKEINGVNLEIVEI